MSSFLLLFIKIALLWYILLPIFVDLYVFIISGKFSAITFLYIASSSFSPQNESCIIPQEKASPRVGWYQQKGNCKRKEKTSLVNRESKRWIGSVVSVPRGRVRVEVCKIEWHIHMLWADKDLSNTLHARMIEIIIAPCSQTAGKKKCFHNFLAYPE